MERLVSELWPQFTSDEEFSRSFAGVAVQSVELFPPAEPGGGGAAQRGPGGPVALCPPGRVAAAAVCRDGGGMLLPFSL